MSPASIPSAVKSSSRPVCRRVGGGQGCAYGQAGVRGVHRASGKHGLFYFKKIIGIASWLIRTGLGAWRVRVCATCRAGQHHAVPAAVLTRRTFHPSSSPRALVFPLSRSQPAHWHMYQLASLWGTGREWCWAGVVEDGGTGAGMSHACMAAAGGGEVGDDGAHVPAASVPIRVLGAIRSWPTWQLGQRPQPQNETTNARTTPQKTQPREKGHHSNHHRFSKRP